MGVTAEIPSPGSTAGSPPQESGRQDEAASAAGQDTASQRAAKLPRSDPPASSDSCSWEGRTPRRGYPAGSLGCGCW